MLLTFDLYSTANHSGGAPVPVPDNVHTYAELDGQHYLIEDDPDADGDADALMLKRTDV